MLIRKMRNDLRRMSNAELLWTSTETLRHCRFKVQPDKKIVPSLGKLKTEYNNNILKRLIDEELDRRYNHKEVESPVKSKRLPVFMQLAQEATRLPLKGESLLTA